MFRPLRVAVLFEYASLNGGEYSFLSMLPYLRAQHVETTAVAPADGPLADWLRAHDVPVVPWCPVGKQTLEPAHLATWRGWLAQRLNDLRPHLVHANSLSTSRRLGPVARAQNMPSVGHVRDIVGVSRQTYLDLQCLDRILAVSQATKEWHVQRGLSPHNVEVLYNGVDLRRFQPRRRTGDLQRQLGIPGDARLVGCIGQLGIRKGTDVFLRTAHDLAEEFPDVHWLVVGERHSTKAESVAYCAELQRMAALPAVAGRVHFLGRRADIPELLGELTLLVHTARQEPLGRVLLEAAAAGLPIVATCVGGTPEIFRHPEKAAYSSNSTVPEVISGGKNRDWNQTDSICGALLVAPDDAPATAEACRHLLNDAVLAKDNGHVARKCAEGGFDVSKRSMELLCHYRSVVGDAPVQRTKG